MNHFKSNSSRKLTKEEYWHKWEFSELLEDLHVAEKMLAGYTEGYSEEFFSAEDFHKALIDAIDAIEFGNQTDLSPIWIWFAPTSTWDDFVGDEGIALGNRIFKRVDKWKKANSTS